MSDIVDISMRKSLAKKSRIFFEDLISIIKSGFSTYGTALDKDDKIVDPIDPSAVKWSIVGACIKLTSEKKHHEIIVRACVLNIDDCIKIGTDNAFDLKLFESAQKTQEQAIEIIEELISVNKEFENENS